MDRAGREVLLYAQEHKGHCGAKLGGGGSQQGEKAFLRRQNLSVVLIVCCGKAPGAGAPGSTRSCPAVPASQAGPERARIPR